MKTKSEIQKLIAEALQKAFSTAVPAGEIHLEHPADRSHGDWATNVAMTLTKDLGQNPRQIAEQLANAFPQNEIVEKVEVAGPGFINFYINPGLYKTLLSQIDDKYGYHKLMVGKTLMIEFGQPNTHKEFHVGHLKSAISGLAISNMMEALGYKVLRVNYFGDVGLQVAKSTWGFMQKDRPGDFENWDVHKKMKYVDECYVFGSQQMKEDPKVEAEIREINKQVYARASTPAVEVYGQIREWSIEHVNLVFAKLGVVYDRQYPESEVDAEAVKIVKEHIGEIFVESEEAIIYDGKQEGLTTWVFITKEGLPTYSAKDLALAYKKFAEYNPDLSIVTTSVEQRDYFKVVIRALERIDSKFVGKYMNLPFGWLLRNNKKASSRMGENVKGVDILHEAEELAIQKIKVDKSYDAQEKARIAELISLAGLKFLILSHEFHKDVNYDPETFISLEGYSGPYVLYSLTRANSILRDAPEVAEIDLNDEGLLGSDVELAVLQTLARFPEITLEAAQQYAPHLICNYVYQLAQEFNKFYAELSVLNAEDDKQRAARIKLTRSVAQVLKSGLHLLGIEAVERM